jgi:uncharacterized protein
MPADERKIFVRYADVHHLVEKIARDIKASGWEPDVIVAIASGGFIPARILKTFIRKDVYAVGLRRYSDDPGEAPQPVPKKIQWIDEVERKLSGKRVLLVDEVDDTRVTLAYCARELLLSGASEIRVAVLHQKEKRKEAALPAEVKTIYQGAVVADAWIKYPWDALDIDAHERGRE